MKLSVTGRYVDLDFGTVTPVKLAGKFATEEIAQSAARTIAVQIEIDEYAVYSEKTQSTQTVSLANVKRLVSSKNKQNRKR